MTRLLALDFNACRRLQQEPYRLLARRGNLQVRLLVPGRWKEPFGEAEADLGLRNEGLDVRALPLRFSGRYHRVLFRGLGREVADFKPDVVWASAEPENFLAVQALLALRKGAPSAALALVSWRNIDYPRNGLPYKAAAAHQCMEDLARDAGAVVLCYNADAMRSMAGRGFATRPTLMGVNLDYFSPGPRGAARAELGLPAKGFVAGFVGRCLEEKGVADLIRALAEIPGSRLLLVGDGPRRKAWMEQASAAGVAAKALSLGHDKVALAMRSMDVLCLPSRSTATWKEQFGRVLIEAMACAVPVLGSDSGAIPDVIRAAPPKPGGFSRGKGGLVFPEGDVAGLRKALLALHAPATAAALGREGLRRAKASFTWKAIAPGLEAQMEALAKEGRRPRLLGLDIFGGDRAGLVERFARWLDARPAAGGRARLLFYLNAHLVVQAGSDEKFRSLLAEADLLLPDGKGVVLALRAMGLPARERLALGDVLPDLVAAAAGKRRSVFFWGGAPGVAREAAEALARRIPGLRVAGHADGFQDAAGLERMRARLKRLRPGLLLLGMGSPKQEALALSLAGDLPRGAVAVCGNAFTFLAGRQRRAPRWMAAAGLEWLWRLALEPRRLAGRYTVGNLKFAGHLLRARLAGRA
ncbi:MAG TPA: WecB/TagA/CpsF family glycosyltransferase [bacterium]|jgi:exopolysaccharide biosynthesis WecB/TagA/CpsF family protein|nr:WecB/TagA/CpsF family glycosyltransferase [bacterium]